MLGAATLALAASVLPWYRRVVVDGGVVEVQGWAPGVESRAASWCWPAVLGLPTFSLACLMTRWLDWSGWSHDPFIDRPEDSVVSAHTNALNMSLRDCNRGAPCRRARPVNGA